MVSIALQAGKELSGPSRGDVNRYTGTVVYIYSFDVAYEMSRQPLQELLGQPVAQFEVDADKRSPREFLFFRPQMVRFPPVDRKGPFGPIQIDRTVKLLPVGAITITISVPFDNRTMEELVVYHDLEFSGGGYLYDEVRRLAEDVRNALAPHCIRPVAQLGEEEAYTVFCISSPLRSELGEPATSEEWLRIHRREVASLLTQEAEIERLSHQEADESTGRYLSYYERDLAVIDWDAALIIDDPKNFDETLYVMELANLQLAELEAYDRLLDSALDRSYRDLGSQPSRPRKDVLRELREIRIDMARFSDELSNITKFFGDWHLARLYECISARFHLADWRRIIEEKLKTLDDLYQLLQHDRINRWMLILEATIVLLFIVDLVLLVLGLQGG